jgi:hypothetical protein
MELLTCGECFACWRPIIDPQLGYGRSHDPLADTADLPRAFSYILLAGLWTMVEISGPYEPIRGVVEVSVVCGHCPGPRD